MNRIIKIKKCSVLGIITCVYTKSCKYMYVAEMYQMIYELSSYLEVIPQEHSCLQYYLHTYMIKVEAKMIRKI